MARTVRGPRGPRAPSRLDRVTEAVQKQLWIHPAPTLAARCASSFPNEERGSGARDHRSLPVPLPPRDFAGLPYQAARTRPDQPAYSCDMARYVIDAPTLVHVV